MTDKEKLYKIVAEIKRLYVYWDGVMQSSAATEAVARKNQCRELLSFYDILQAESKKESVIEVEKIMAEVDAKFPKFAEEVGDIHSCDPHFGVNIEPVSEDLNTAAKEYANNITKKIGYRLQLRRAVCFGAKLKEEQFEKNRLEHCNSITNEQAELEQGFIDQHLDKYQRMPTFLDAIEYGMRLQKEKMMKNVVDGEILEVEDDPHAMCISTHLEVFVEDDLKKLGLKAEDKVKIVIVKSE